MTYFTHTTDLTKKFWFFGILLLNLHLCPAQETSLIQEGKVIICGKVRLDSSSPKVISLTYSQLSASPTRLTSVLDSSGSFHFEFDILHPHNLLLRYGKGTAELYVGQSDSLFVAFNSSDFMNTAYPDFSVSGTTPDVSRDILNYHRYHKLPPFKPAPAGKSVQAYILELKRYIDSEDSVLSAFIKDRHPTPTFINWAKKDIIYKNANYLVDYEAHHAMRNTTFEGNLYDTTLFPVNNPDALVSSWYQYHLWQYALARYAKNDTTIQRYFQQQLWGNAYGACLKKVMVSEQPGLSRDVISYQLLFATAERAFPEFQVLMKNVSHYIGSNPLIAILKSKMEQTENKEKFKISLFQSESKIENEVLGDILETIIAKNKGQVIYIDFWATWCGPCRSEVPYAIELHNGYKGKPVAFVNLCLASERETWKKAIVNQKIAGDNYFLDKDQSALLTRKLNLAGFPTYMIVDKTGQLIDRQAPRPSSGNVIRERLDKLVE